MSKLPHAIFFDADGTLYDSELLNFKLNQMTARKLYDFDFTWELYDVHIRRGNKSSSEVVQAHGVSVDHAAWHAYKLKHYRTLIVEQLSALPGLLDFLQWCKAQNIRCAVVSAAGRDYVESSLAATEIQDFFEFMVTHEDVVPDLKPHPQAYRLALSIADLKADQVIAVEDTDKGINSAQAAGLFCVGIRNDANSRAELHEAEHIIHDYKELKAYLLR